MGQQSSDSDTLQVRLDKWLWAARFYKTRSIARNMIDGGKVHYNGQRSKPSKLVEVGAEVRLRQGSDEKPLLSTNCPAPAGGAPPEAQTLYQETAESIKLRENHAQMRKLNAFDSPSPDKRPDKKQRRDIIKFKSSN